MEWLLSHCLWIMFCNTIFQIFISWLDHLTFVTTFRILMIISNHLILLHPILLLNKIKLLIRRFSSLLIILFIIQIILTNLIIYERHLLWLLLWNAYIITFIFLYWIAFYLINLALFNIILILLDSYMFRMIIFQLIILFGLKLLAFIDWRILRLYTLILCDKRACLMFRIILSFLLLFIVLKMQVFIIVF